MKTRIIIIFVALLTVASCKKENEEPTLSDQYFPNRVGNYWVYDRFDSLDMEATELKIEIVKDSVANDGYTYCMWLFSKSKMYDTLYVRTTEDSILFYRYLEGYPFEVMLQPLTLGQKWTQPYMVRDSSFVLTKDTLTIGSFQYPNAYKIHRRLAAFNDYMSDDRWFIPNLGIAKLENWHYLFGWISKETWLLTSYNLQ
jgi:hypothetical protein